MAEKIGTSQTRAKNKYNAKAYDSLRVVVPKGKKALTQLNKHIHPIFALFWLVWGFYR